MLVIVGTSVPCQVFMGARRSRSSEGLPDIEEGNKILCIKLENLTLLANLDRYLFQGVHL